MSHESHTSRTKSVTVRRLSDRTGTTVRMPSCSEWDTETESAVDADLMPDCSVGVVTGIEIRVTIILLI